MNLVWHDIKDGMASKVFVDGKYIGLVEVERWPNIWIMKPVFHYNYRLGHDTVKEKYESQYTAGKAMAKLYEETFSEFDDDDITDEIDMRGIFGTFTPWGIKYEKISLYVAASNFTIFL